MKMMTRESSREERHGSNGSPASTDCASVNTVMLRKWKDADQEPYAAMNADPEAMRYFPATLSKAAARESFLRLRTTLDERGWGVWANGVVR